MLFCNVDRVEASTSLIRQDEQINLGSESFENGIIDYYSLIICNETGSKQLEAQIERKLTLEENGYSVFDTTFDDRSVIERELNTDLSEIIPDGGEYLIVLGDPDHTMEMYPSTTSIGSAGETFTYTYSGHTYTMRILTVTSANGGSSYMTQSSYKELFRSKIRSTIVNALDTAIYAYVGTVSSALGTLGQLLGLSIDDLSLAGQTYAIFNASTSWTCYYMQVYDDQTGVWKNGSCVERAKKIWYINGFKYLSNGGTSSFRTANNLSYVTSPHYSDGTWKKVAAIQNYCGTAGCLYDYTGNISYKYGSTTIITHREAF